MTRTFLYTQIKTNDFNVLKSICKPYTKDIFGASQEYIVAFEKPEQAGKASMEFLNNITTHDDSHQYKVVLVNGAFDQSRPEEMTIRIARSIHKRTQPRNLYFTDDVLQMMNPDDVIFENKTPILVKELQKEIQTYALSRWGETELISNPTDLFDFSQVDSYSAVTQSPSKPAKNPYESSNTILELDAPRNTLESGKVPAVFNSIPVDTGKVNPSVSGRVAPAVTYEPTSKLPEKVARSTPPIDLTPTPSQLKSLMIVGVVLLLITVGGYFLVHLRNTDPKNVFMTTNKLGAPNQIQEPVVPASGIQSQITGATKIEGSSEALPQPGFINIHSTPKDGVVWIDGKDSGFKTPLDGLRIKSKSNTQVEVRKDGYQKVSKKVTLDPAETVTVLFQLTPNAGTTPTNTLTTVTKTTPKKSSTKSTSKTTKKPAPKKIIRYQ